MWDKTYRRVRLLSSSCEVETWLLEGTEDGERCVGKRCLAPHSPGWSRLLAMVSIQEKLAPLRWHPGAPHGVPGLRQFFQDPTELCLVCDFVPGEACAVDVAVFAALARLLSRIHALGVIHGDVKPSNVIITPEGTPVLLDFGYWGGAPLDSSLTPRYVSPELSGEVEARVGPAADLYSLGVMLQEKLSEAARPRYLGVLQRLLQPRPEARYQDGEALALDLESLAGGEDPAVSPAPLSAPAAFVGRCHELERLMGARQLAVQGQGGWVSLAGSSGMGKTRLLEEFAVRSGFRVLQGGCYEGGLQRSYGLFQEAFESLSAADVSAPLPLLAAGLLSTVFPKLSQVLDCQGEAPTTLGVLHLEQLTEALSLLLERLGSKERPVLWVFDDLQWAGPETCDLLLRLSRRSRGCFLICLLFRPEEWSPPPINFNVELALKPLTEEEVRQLAGWVRPLADPRWVQAGGQWSQGNPFFLWEFLRGGPEEVTQVSDRAMLHLRQRFAGLQPQTRRVLSVCALVGRDFPLPLLRSLFEASVLEPALREAVLQRMVRVSGDSGHFVHDRLRESALALLDAAEESEWHRRIAAKVDDPGEKGHHLYHAGDVAAAHPFCLEAARAARLSLALPRARVLYQMCLQGQDDLEVRIELHHVHKALGLKEEALRILEEVLERPLRDEIAARIHGTLTIVLHEWLQPVKTIWHAREALRLLGQPVPQRLSWAVLVNEVLQLGRHLFGPPLPAWQAAIQLDAAQRLLWADLFTAEEGSFGLFILRSTWLAWRHRDQKEATIWLGNLACTFEHFQLNTLAGLLGTEVRRRVAGMNDPLAAALSLGPITVPGLAQRDQRPAYEQMRQYVAILERHSDFWGINVCQMILSWFRLGMGELTELARESQRVYGWAEQYDHATARANGLYGLLLADPGRVTGAQIARVCASYSGTGSLLDVRVACCAAIVSVRDGSFERALQHLSRLQPKLPRLRMMVAVWLATVARTAAEALPRSAARRREELLTQAEQALASGLKHSPMVLVYHCHALRERALLLLARGKPEAARRAFLEALQETLDCHMPYEETLTRLEWARAGRLLDWPEALEHERVAILHARDMEAGWLIPHQTGLPSLEELTGLAERLLVARSSAQREQLREQGLSLSHHTLAEQIPQWTRFWKALAGVAEERCRLEALVGEAEQATRRRWSRPPEVQAHGGGLRVAQAHRFYELSRARRQQRLRTLDCPYLPGLRDELENLWLDPPAAPLDEIAQPFLDSGLRLTRPPKEPPLERLAPAARTAARALLRESFNNILKYVPQPSAVLTYRVRDQHLEISVSDPGPGRDHSNTGVGGFGLRALNWRARLAGGSFQVGSPLEGGTRVSMRLPLLAGPILNISS